jgi:hypothetical protein
MPDDGQMHSSERFPFNGEWRSYRNVVTALLTTAWLERNARAIADNAFVASL